MVHKKSIIELSKETIIILDGGMGSMLINAGLPGNILPESWNVLKPDIIKDIHRQYFSAGSDVVLTNTFGGSRIKLQTKNEGAKVDDYNTQAVLNAREVCPEGKFVAGDIGPTGLFLPPVGKGSIEDLQEAYSEQAQILSQTGVDLFFVETMYDIREAEVAIKAIKKVSNLPIFLSMTFRKTKRGYYTMMGDSVEKCIEVLENAKVDALGANCTIGSDEMVDIIPQIRKLTNLLIIAKPNAGKPELREGKTVYSATSSDFTNDISLMINSGANIIGGCCGTTPEFIRSISQLEVFQLSNSNESKI